MFGDVRECSASSDRKNDETNPTRSVPTLLTPRQISAARLLVLGRCGRDVARELGVEEHTVTRWRRLPAFAAELARQQRLALKLQLSESP